MPHLSAARFFSHFYTPLGLLLGGLVAAQQSSLNEFFTSLFNVLPTVLLLLGGAFCIAYGRIREASLLLLIYLAYFCSIPRRTTTASAAPCCLRRH